MAGRLRHRFWIESIIGSGTGILALSTLIWRDWIEVVFGVDPDKGNGSTERFIVVILVLITVSLAVGAHVEWRRAHRLATS